jgi:hypothetical protein
MRDILRDITESENGLLSINETTVLTGIQVGAYGDQENYHIKLDYKGSSIEINARIGVQSSCSVNCFIATQKENTDFEIESRDHLFILFSKNKTRLRIKCNNTQLRHFLEVNSILIELEKMAKETKFEPYIIAAKTEGYLKLTAEYHLEFPQRDMTFKPLVQLFKDLIDYFLN